MQMLPIALVMLAPCLSLAAGSAREHVSATGRFTLSK